jgi:hypothetical protein
MKNRLLNWLLRRTINPVIPQDIIKVDKGVIYIGGIKTEDTELRSLQAEAKAMENFAIWRIMNETLRAEAIDRGWNKSTTYDDLKTGKLMIYSLDVMESIINIIKRQKL